MRRRKPRRSLLEIVDNREIPQKCLNLLAASANENSGAIKKENYYVFTDGLSNGYYSFNGMTSYTDLPYPNKFGFVTLSCMCKIQNNDNGNNCCQGNRAHLDVSKLDIDNPQLMEEEMQYYIYDICKTTSDAIGENVLPDTEELLGVGTTTTMATTTDWLGVGTKTMATEATATMATAESLIPVSITMATTESTTPVSSSGTADTSSDKQTTSTTPDTANTKEANAGEDDAGGSLTVGAWAGIAIAVGVSFLIILLALIYFARRKKKGAFSEAIESENDDKNIDDDFNEMAIVVDDDGQSHADETQGASTDVSQDTVVTENYESRV